MGGVIPCPDCSGAGFVYKGDGGCRRCGGRGRVLRQEGGRSPEPRAPGPGGANGAPGGAGVFTRFVFAEAVFAVEQMDEIQVDALRRVLRLSARPPGTEYVSPSGGGSALSGGVLTLLEGPGAIKATYSAEATLRHRLP